MNHKQIHEFTRDCLIFSLRVNATKSSLTRQDSLHQISSSEFKTPAATLLLDRNKPQKNARVEKQYLFTKFCRQWHAAGRCLAYGQSCNFFGKANHFARVCWSKTTKKLLTNTVSFIDRRSSNSELGAQLFEDGWRSESELFLENVSCDLRRVERNQRVAQNNYEWTEILNLNGITIECKEDTGAQAHVTHLKIALMSWI